MQRTTLTIWMIGLLAASTAVGENNWIYEANGWDDWDDYRVIQGEIATIEIRRPVAGTFRFYARDLDSGDLGYINSITVWSGWQGTGTIRVMVWGPTNGEYGAENVGEIYLSTWYQTTTQIAGIWIRGNLGHEDYSLADEATTGIYIEGDLLDRFVVSSCAVDVEVDGSVYNDLWLGEMTGDVTIGTNLYGGITFSRNGTTQVLGLGPHTAGGGCTYPFSGDVLINGPLSGNLVFHDEMTGTVDVNGDFSGKFQARDAFSGTVHIQGDASPGSGNPILAVWQDLDGQILIDGSLLNGTGHEIDIDGTVGSNGAVAIDYDGWHEGDDWESTGATIAVGTNSYSHNEPSLHLWEITGCKADMNNDNYVNSDDDDPFDDALNDIPQYESDFPGLEGSRIWHGDANADGTFDQHDQASYDFLSSEECCVTDWSFCPTDLNYDGITDLDDLALLLADYGCTSECTADVDGDDDVDLSDLAVLLSVYGDDCDCSGGGGGGGGGRSTITVHVEAYDTGGYTGGGFNGEVDHFVFDLKIELSDPNDDWVATGAELDAYNDATFRLSTTPTTPDQYATFVAAPWTSVPESATASVAGAYDPPDLDPEFTTTGINLAWYDTADSNDGPATIMRIVIDVSDVEGADVSEGFGSVYFSTTGPAQKEDILVADLVSETGTADSVPGLKWLSGEFYVNGKE